MRLRVCYADALDLQELGSMAIDGYEGESVCVQNGHLRARYAKGAERDDVEDFGDQAKQRQKSSRRRSVVCLSMEKSR